MRGVVPTPSCTRCAAAPRRYRRGGSGPAIAAAHRHEREARRDRRDGAPRDGRRESAAARDRDLVAAGGAADARFRRERVLDAVVPEAVGRGRPGPVREHDAAADDLGPRIQGSASASGGFDRQDRRAPRPWAARPPAPTPLRAHDGPAEPCLRRRPAPAANGGASMRCAARRPPTARAGPGSGESTWLDRRFRRGTGSAIAPPDRSRPARPHPGSARRHRDLGAT